MRSASVCQARKVQRRPQPRGARNGYIGSSFYAYWAFAPQFTELGNSNLRYLVWQRVELVAPVTP
jgi:hypothetical protein